MKLLINILFATALITGAGYSSAKSAPTVNNNVEDRHLSGFKAISISGSFDVYITQGSAESVRVEAPADVMKHIVTEVRGGVLKIYNRDHFSWGNLFGGHKITVYVNIKDINGIELSGSGDVYFKQGITANSLQLKLSGSGDLTGKVNAKTLESSISGSGDMKIYGHVESSAISLTGSGDFSARDLSTANTAIRVVGSGDAYINASNKIEASVTGSGDVHYSGRAQNISKSKTGSGDIERY